MKLHGNAALSWSGRRRLGERVVVEGWTLAAAAEAAGVSVRCARKWVGRYRLEGEAGLLDRSSAPRRVANRTPAERVAAIVALRWLRMTAAEIAEILAMPLSTVSAVLTRAGLGRLGRLGLEQPLRYERSRPGELVHIDVKQLGRIEGGAGKRMTAGIKRNADKRRLDAAGVERKTIGWEYVHVAVDDHSRLAYAEVLPDQKARTAIAFLHRSARLLPPLRDRGRASAHRQRLRLRLRPARTRLSQARHPPPTHSSLPPADERQGRALHPHPPRRLGLRRHLRLEQRTHRSP
jgi:transposase